MISLWAKKDVNNIRISVKTLFGTWNCRFFSFSLLCLKRLKYNNLIFKNMAKYEIVDGVGILAEGVTAIGGRSLLAYCRLDTLAMVRIWEKLKEVVGKE
jgi:hypothetical protein